MTYEDRLITREELTSWYERLVFRLKTAGFPDNPAEIISRKFTFLGRNPDSENGIIGPAVFSGTITGFTFEPTDTSGQLVYGAGREPLRLSVTPGDLMVPCFKGVEETNYAKVDYFQCGSSQEPNKIRDGHIYHTLGYLETYCGQSFCGEFLGVLKLL